MEKNMNNMDILRVAATPIEIGRRVKELRCASDLSVQDLSEKIFISINGLRRIEKGCVTPSISTLLLLAIELGVSTDYLLVGRELSVR